MRKRTKKSKFNKKSKFDKNTLMKKYPKLMTRLLGNHRIGGSQLQRFKILSKLSINLLFDNANNEDLIKLKSDLLSEGTNLDELMDRAIYKVDGDKISSPIQYTKNVLGELLKIRGMQNNYDREVRSIAGAIEKFDRYFTQRKKRENRENDRLRQKTARMTDRESMRTIQAENREIRQTVRDTDRVIRQSTRDADSASRQSARDADKASRQLQREADKAARQSTRKARGRARIRRKN